MNQEIQDMLKRLERLESKETPTKPNMSGYLTLAEANMLFQRKTGWQAYSPTLIGWDSDPYSQCVYVTLGNEIVIVNIYVQGTSNSTITRVTLPKSLKVRLGNQAFVGSARIQNAGSWINTGIWTANPNSEFIAFYANSGLTNLSSSGSKIVQCVALIGVQRSDM